MVFYMKIVGWRSIHILVERSVSKSLILILSNIFYFISFLCLWVEQSTKHSLFPLLTGKPRVSENSANLTTRPCLQD